MLSGYWNDCYLPHLYLIQKTFSAFLYLNDIKPNRVNIYRYVTITISLWQLRNSVNCSIYSCLSFSMIIFLLFFVKSPPLRLSSSEPYLNRHGISLTIHWWHTFQLFVSATCTSQQFCRIFQILRQHKGNWGVNWTMWMSDPTLRNTTRPKNAVPIKCFYQHLWLHSSFWCEPQCWLWFMPFWMGYCH